MAFCTGCGSQIENAAKFCPACGTRVPDAVAPGTQSGSRESSFGGGAAATTTATSTATTPAATATAPSLGNRVQPVAAPSGGGSALKIIIIIAVVIVGLALLAFAGLFWATYKVKKAIRVEQNGDNATVSTPWGKVSSNQDSAQVAKELGVDVYPGAKPLPGASAVTFAGGAVGSAEFQSDDSIEKVGKFYSSRYPKSTVNSQDENNQTIMASTNKGMITIVLVKQDGGTKISLSRIGGRSATHGGSETE
jgi:zinc-ribbon domain